MRCDIDNEAFSLYMGEKLIFSFSCDDVNNNDVIFEEMASFIQSCRKDNFYKKYGGEDKCIKNKI